MVRTQIQLDEAIYQRVKNRAHSENRSMSALIREAVSEYMNAPDKANRKLTIDDFTFIGSGSAEHPPGRPLSVYHDEAWEEDWRD